MDIKKLEALIKKNEKRRDAQKKKVKAAEAKAVEERKNLEAIEAELKPMYDLRKKFSKFEKSFNESVAGLAGEEGIEVIDEPETEEAEAEKPEVTF